MTHWVNLFTPETWQMFQKSDRTLSGFRLKQRGVAERVAKGDVLVCYITRLSRWCGLLEVVDGPFVDHSPFFATEYDPFPLRFHVKPLIVLDAESSIPMRDPSLWKGLSFTHGLPPGSTGWTNMVRASLRAFEADDGVALASALQRQVSAPSPFPFDDDDRRKLKPTTVHRSDRSVPVVVPEAREEETASPDAPAELRESLRIQALLAHIGDKLGLQIWIPRNDRGGVLSEWKGDHAPILDRLPLNYDDTTLKTIEQIDVLWLRGRSIVRAFEVEHTTSIYSGLLRMADLLALQPNMDIQLSIVAPEARREKVFRELQRPVFSLLERGPLAEHCGYLSYQGVRDIAALPQLGHAKATVVEEYEESAGEG